MSKLTLLRNAELLSVARQELGLAMRRGQAMSMNRLIELTLAHQPTAHYIDFDTASERLHAIERHGLDAVVRKAEARGQWEELLQQVRDTMAGRRRLTFARALSFVLHFRRPSRFYLSPNAAFKILRSHFRPSLIDLGKKSLC